MNYTDEQIEKQFTLLSEEVQGKLFSPEIERSVQKIGVSEGLLIDQLKRLNTLTNLVILEILSKGDFLSECQQVFGIDQKTAENIWEAISRDVLSSLEKLKMQALHAKVLREREEKESEGILTNELATAESTIAITPPAQPRPPEKMADIAPDNLPTEETVESFLPNLAPKTVSQGPIADDETPLFEQKMKKVFTGTSVSSGDLALENPLTPTQSSQPPIPQKERSAPPPPRVPPVSSAGDPYREPIE